MKTTTERAKADGDSKKALKKMKASTSLIKTYYRRTQARLNRLRYLRFLWTYASLAKARYGKLFKVSKCRN